MSSVLRKYQDPDDPELDPVATAYRPRRIYYIDICGTNTVSSGTELQPFRTLQYAHDTADISDRADNQVIMYIRPGVYSENLTITKVNILWRGLEPYSQLSSGLVTFSGVVDINITTGNSDPFSIFNGFQGIHFYNTSSSPNVTLQSTKLSRNIFKTCKFYSEDGPCFLNTSPNNIVVDDCQMNLASSSSTNDCLKLTDGRIDLLESGIFTSGDGYSINCISEGVLRLNRCFVQNTNASSSAGAVINFDNSGSTITAKGPSQISVTFIGSSSTSTSAMNLRQDKTPTELQFINMGFSSTAVGSTNRFIGTGQIYSFSNVSALSTGSTDDGTIDLTPLPGF
jgi:hypothetical protein